MMNQLQLIAVPGWISQWLMISKQPLSILADMTKLSTTLCKEDVAFYVYCQELSQRAMDPDLIQSFGTCCAGGVNPDVYESIERFRLQNPNDSIRPLFDGSMTFTADEGGNSYHDYTYELVEITSNVLGYRLLKPNQENTRNEDREIALSDVLNRLTVYTDFCHAASTPAMKAYVRLAAGLK